jgi:aryl-alcohol dehydrogenase-like predicted oxidoreductase
MPGRRHHRLPTISSKPFRHSAIIPGTDRQDLNNIILHSIEAGVTFFDTAEMYGPFTNEALVGEALVPYRDQVVVATKFGFDIKDGKD